MLDNVAIRSTGAGSRCAHDGVTGVTGTVRERTRRPREGRRPRSPPSYASTDESVKRATEAGGSSGGTRSTSATALVTAPTRSRLDPHASRDCARFASIEVHRCTVCTRCRDVDAAVGRRPGPLEMGTPNLGSVTPFRHTATAARVSAPRFWYAWTSSPSPRFRARAPVPGSRRLASLGTKHRARRPPSRNPQARPRGSSRSAPIPHRWRSQP